MLESVLPAFLYPDEDASGDAPLLFLSGLVDDLSVLLGVGMDAFDDAPLPQIVTAEPVNRTVCVTVPCVCLCV